MNTKTKTIAALPKMLQAKVQAVPTGSLRPYPNNARLHAAKQVERIAVSIERFGFVNPILADGSGEIIAGHGRWEAAKRLGLKMVPAIRIEHLSEAELKAYRIADNRLAELAEWDEATLAIELETLLEFDDSFDVTVTGFDLPDIDVMIQNTREPDPDDAMPDVDPAAPVVSRPGDVWVLGRHRLMCGDALDGQAYAALMEGEKAQVVFTDPPYNVPVDGHVCGKGAVKHAEFAMASGEMSPEAFTAFLQTAFGHMAAHSSDGAIHFICMDWRHLREILTAGDAVYTDLKNVCVWNKTNGGMGSLYRSKHELVFVFKHGTAAHINNVDLGRHGRNRTNVWDYAGINSLRPDRIDELRLHPTVKPVAMVADAILDCSRRNGIVLDPFGGSGTTLLAAERTGRRACVMELEPRYVDVAVRRWQATTGETRPSFPDRRNPGGRCREARGPNLTPSRPLVMTRRKNMAKTYDVGYAKPPKSTRFQKGRSGNPRGRPKGTRNLKTDLAEELAETVLLTEGGKTRKVSKQRAMLKATVNKAIRGDTRAHALLLTLRERYLDGETEEPRTLHPDDREILELYIASRQEK